MVVLKGLLTAEYLVAKTAVLSVVKMEAPSDDPAELSVGHLVILSAAWLAALRGQRLVDLKEI